MCFLKKLIFLCVFLFLFLMQWNDIIDKFVWKKQKINKENRSQNWEKKLDNFFLANSFFPFKKNKFIRWTMNTVRWWEIINGLTKIYSLKRELCRPSHKIHLVQAHFSIRWVVWKLCIFFFTQYYIGYAENERVSCGALMWVGVCDYWIFFICGHNEKLDYS